MNLKNLRYAGAAAGLAVALAAVVGGTVAFTPRPTQVRLELNHATLDRQGPYTTSYAPVVEQVSPSVVQLYTTTRLRPAALPDLNQLPPGFRRFFEPFSPRGGQRSPMERMPRQQGVGSGVIVTTDGYILTNNHVVDGADQVQVVLADGGEYAAKVIGADPKTDVAVLKIPANDVPAIVLADSDEIAVGDLVLAVGNPFGIGQTVTLGMVSAKGRGNMGLDYEDFIQTDAAINPGNSGGALVDTQGRLVGINTAILSRSGGNQGIGFAIPSNLARHVMESLIEDGRVARGYLGVMIQDLTPDLAAAFSVENRSGALVSEVSPDGPAANAGIENGDVIVEFKGKTVKNGRELRLRVAESRPGTRAPVKVLRDGSPKTLEVTLAELPGTQTLARAGRSPSADTERMQGVTVQDLSPDIRRAYELPDHVEGAIITNVDPDSAAAAAGLRPGDVIQEIDRKPVRSASDALRLTERATDGRTLVRVWKDGHSQFRVVDESMAG